MPKIILDLTDEEFEKLGKLAERVNKSINAQGKLPNVTRSGALLNFIKSANVDDDWEHPASAARKKK